jgi:uncharacterized membrane protein YkoI
MTDNSSLPESTPSSTTSAEPDAVISRTETSSAPAPADRARRSLTRTLLFAGGGVLAAALLTGGGIAVGAAIADEMDDDDDDRTSGITDDGARDAASGTEDRSSADIGTTSADELNDLIGAASADAEGEPVSIEANRDGSWDVQFETTAGDETEVRVSTDGSVAVVATDAADANDSAPEGVLDAATVDALVAAALAEVDGKVVDLEIDDDPASPFDVSVLQADGTTVDLDFDADLTLLSTDRT